MKLEEVPLQELQSLYVKCKQVYFTKGTPQLSDPEYDRLERFLKERTPDFWALSVVGPPFATASLRSKKPHRMHMGSVANAMDEAEFERFWDRTGGQQVYATLKVDGLSIAAYYDAGGRLTDAVTRGNGKEGDDVTANASKARSLPAVTRTPIGNVRGEIVLLNEDWEKLKDADPDIKTARNYASGMLRRSSGVGCERLVFIAHWLDPAPPHAHLSYYSRIVLLREHGFIVPPGKLCNTLDDCKSFHLWVTEQRQNAKLKFEIDGIVFTANDMAYFARAGIDNDACPRAQVAWKFPSQKGQSRLKGVEWTVGHTGTLNPTGIVEPVTIGGVCVQRASLCNMDEIGRLGIHLDDVVEVSRQGDVIPKITGRVAGSAAPQALASPAEWAERSAIRPPSRCPECGGEVGHRQKVKGGDTTALYCLNAECPAQSTGKIKHWVKKTEMKDVGPTIVEAMVDAELVQTPADLYTLATRQQALADMPFGKGVLGTTRAKKVVDSIEKRRALPLNVFIGALGIPGLGEGVARNVREAAPGEFDRLEDWVPSGQTVAKLLALKDQVGLTNVGVRIVESLGKAAPLVAELLAAGASISDAGTRLGASNAPQNGSGGGPLAGKVFCLTGDFPLRKAAYHDRIVEAGGTFETDVRSNVTHVVIDQINGKLTGKAEKAQKKGILIDLATLEGMLK
jgi:DNA ligase (NAD+)